MTGDGLICEVCSRNSRASALPPGSTGHAYSLIIPVYRNEESLPELLAVLAEMDRELDRQLEVVFVIDGSPDRSHAFLRAELPRSPFCSQLIAHSRNFGSFPAIRTGLAHARGRYFSVMAADLQEPPSLIVQFFATLSKEEHDIVLGTRIGRSDPLTSRLFSRIFWSLYRRFVQPEVPTGGVDIFGCTARVRDHLLQLEESHTTLVGLLLWLGFRRAEIGYERLPRRHGRSSWSISRKLAYLMDSVFAFSDLPIRVLVFAGAFGIAVSLVLGTVVVFLKFSGLIPLPGYAATICVVLFFAALNSFGLGLIGSYLWRTFENTKHRPTAVVATSENFPKGMA